MMTFIAMLGATGVAVAVLSRWYDQRGVRRVKRAVNALPCRTVSELVEGERAWVAGSVRAIDIAGSALASADGRRPASNNQAKVVVYDLNVDVAPHSEHGPRSVSVPIAEPFWLEDATGRVYVDGRGAVETAFTHTTKGQKVAIVVDGQQIVVAGTAERTGDELRLVGVVGAPLLLMATQSPRNR